MFIFAAIMAVVAASCEKAKILYASVEKIEVTAKGGEGSVVLASDVEKFMVESAPEWVTTGINGNVMTYKVEENTTGALRSGDIMISVPGKEMTIAVAQDSTALDTEAVEKKADRKKKKDSTSIDAPQKGSVCGKCGGSGRITCRSCRGSGLNRNSNIESSVCFSCGGRSVCSDGSVPDKRGRGWNRCKACRGTGKR